ncbi:MAG: DUF3179 domain-containing (seleno)protein [Gemmatimonadaceae bacterium]
MKRFLFAIAGLLLFEVANVYFIMPLPYSQRVRSVDLAFALYHWRWGIRIALGALALSGLPSLSRATRWKQSIAASALVAVGCAAWLLNFRMSADHMFRAPTTMRVVSEAQNTIAGSHLVVGIEVNGRARAYPLSIIGYHHHVRDTVGGQEILITYCTVCRTGRVYSPMVEGKSERFRLVGMDHFNAMLEDASTGSWWRQATGEAIAGPRKGSQLTEVPSVQTTLERWLTLHPGSLVMQEDSAFGDKYARDLGYERGTSRSALTGTDTASWHDKSWVVGISINNSSMAYDWNRLRNDRVVNDVVGGTPIVLAVADDGVSFVAFHRPVADAKFTLRGDSLVAGANAYDLAGRGAAGNLKLIPSSQEFWHSWRTFHPATNRY